MFPELFLFCILWFIEKVLQASKNNSIRPETKFKPVPKSNILYRICSSVPKQIWVNDSYSISFYSFVIFSVNASKSGSTSRTIATRDTRTLAADRSVRNGPRICIFGPSPVRSEVWLFCWSWSGISLVRIPIGFGSYIPDSYMMNLGASVLYHKERFDFSEVKRHSLPMSRFSIRVLIGWKFAEFGGKKFNPSR